MSPEFAPARRHRGKAKVVPGPAMLLPRQKAWVEDPARLKIAEKSRQIGFTWTEAYGLVRRKSMKGAALDAWISSRDEMQARLFLEDCKGFGELLNIGARDLGEKAIDDSGHSAFVLALANGRRIHSMSSNPDAQAGKRGDRVLDEFALHPDPRKLYAIAYPGITWGGQMEIFSTHRGTANFFNSLIEEIKFKGNPKGFSLHRITLQDALDDGFLHKLQGKLPEGDARQEMDEAEYFDFIRSGCPDEETFQQEYMCNPSDDQSAFLSYELIASCTYRGGETWEIPFAEMAGDLYLGVDVGRDHDLTVFWLCEKFGGVLFTRRVITMKGESFDAQEAELYKLLALPKMRRCCIDASGLGRQFAERARKRFGNKVEEIKFTAPVKEELAYPLRTAFEDRTLRVPDDRLIAADLRSVKKEATASGNIRFAADRGKNGHADRFWAIGLVVHAAKTAGTAAYEAVEGIRSTLRRRCAA